MNNFQSKYIFVRMSRAFSVQKFLHFQNSLITLIFKYVFLWGPFRLYSLLCISFWFCTWFIVSRSSALDIKTVRCTSVSVHIFSTDMRLNSKKEEKVLTHLSNMKYKNVDSVCMSQEFFILKCAEFDKIDMLPLVNQVHQRYMYYLFVSYLWKIYIFWF